MTLDELNLVIKRKEQMVRDLKEELILLKKTRKELTEHGDLSEIREHFFKEKYRYEWERVKKKAFLHVVGKVVGIETLSKEQYDQLVNEIKAIEKRELIKES